MAQRMIEVRDLARQHAQEQEQFALRDVTFTVEEGSILGVLGYDGAGKTTLLRILATLLPPTRGVARIGGYDVVGARQAAKALFAYMPERFIFHRNTTIRKHLDFWARIDGLSRSQRGRRLEDLTAFLGLTDATSESLVELTTLDAQRVALAQALLLDPPVLLLDEPFTPLMAGERGELLQPLRQLNEEGKTLLVTANLLEDVQDLCTDILILDSGRSSRTLSTPELMEAIGSQHHVRIFIEAPEYPESVISALKEMEGVVEIEERGGVVTVFALPGGELESRIRGTFEGEGVELNRIKRAEIPLGDVFRSLRQEGAA